MRKKFFTLVIILSMLNGFRGYAVLIILPQEGMRLEATN